MIERNGDFEDQKEYIEDFLKSLDTKINLTKSLNEFFGSQNPDIDGPRNINDPLNFHDIVFEELKQTPKLRFGTPNNIRKMCI